MSARVGRVAGGADFCRRSIRRSVGEEPVESPPLRSGRGQQWILGGHTVRWLGVFFAVALLLPGPASAHSQKYGHDDPLLNSHVVTMDGERVDGECVWHPPTLTLPVW